MRPFRIGWRLTRLVGHLTAGAFATATLALARRLGARPPVSRFAQWWYGRLCRILSLAIEASGRPAPGTHLMVANHISWLDIPVLGSLQPVAFLSKAEVRDWPLVGWMAEVAGTLFIERGANQSAAIAEAIHARLEDGRSVLFFPEGTTTDGGEVRRFHPRLLAAAQKSGAHLQPVALSYPEPGARRVAPFIGDDRLFPHLLRVLGEECLAVRVTYLQPLEASSRDRRNLAEQARGAIREALGFGEEPVRIADPTGREGS